MKHAQKKTAPDILHKIENIEKEVKDLKLSILKDLSLSGKKVISLKGILKGVTITEQDIAAAQKALLSSVKL
jgi:archaellum component FlaC